MTESSEEMGWAGGVYDLLKKADVRRVSYVPDGGHKALIKFCTDDPTMRTVSLTTEQDGIGFAAGSWLGGLRSVLLMQSSGVGNCINALSLVRNCQIPFLTMITMRGDFGESNNWQIPMGQGTQPVLEAMGVICLRADRAEDVNNTVAAGIAMAFSAQQQIAILLGQRLIGAKQFK